MLKLAIAAIFLSAALPGISQENTNIFEGTQWGEVTHPVYEYIGVGDLNLLSQDYEDALENFDLAMASLENAEEPLYEAISLIHFGRVIAYDNLGLRDQCEQSLGAMFIAIYAAQDDDDENSDENEESSPEDEATIALIQQLASLVRSPDIRGFLLEIFTGD